MIPPISIVSNTLPDVDGLSFHSNLIDRSPPVDPLTIIFLPSSENFAVAPGDVDSIFKLAFSSKSSTSLRLVLRPKFVKRTASSSKLIVFPLLDNLNPKFLGLSKLYETGISMGVFDFCSFIFGC